MIQKAGIKVKTQFKVKEITETAVIGEDASGNTVSIPAVQVISAFWIISNRHTFVMIIISFKISGCISNNVTS